LKWKLLRRFYDCAPLLPGARRGYTVLERRNHGCPRRPNFIMAQDAFTRLDQLIDRLPGLRDEPRHQNARAEQQAWRAAAGDEIADHTVVQPNEQYWLIIADSPVWGHAVTHRQQEIIAALARTSCPITTLKVKVRPRPAPMKPPGAGPKHQTRSLDPQSASLLSDTADGLKSGDLAQALKRLSRHRS